MLTIVIACMVGIGAGVLADIWLNPYWSMGIGFIACAASAVGMNLLIKKRMELLFGNVQQKVEETQDQLRRKINMMQAKMTSGGKGLQRRMEKEQAAGIREAIKELDHVRSLYKWNLLAERQVNTMCAQMYYQIKEFDNADKCFKKCFIMDSLTLAMKMTRQYSRKDEAEKPENAETNKEAKLKELGKAFNKGVKRFKDEQGIILYALYSWILVKEQRIDEAIEVLNDGKEKTEDETIRSNWEHLVNGRTRRFSNAGLGDQWYAMHLENPKPIKVKQRFGGGKRQR